ncbi:unnamed protein product [Phaedon cochleariae]|uniref:Cytochrome P450 n=1 Tax=Phaedon cochleariae TaxID=80249 RepID=A0A9P0GRX2_PHACE|nr:unnamed protein product [Phaedon cochleariae]
MWWIILITLSLVLIHYLMTKNFDYWRNRSVPGPHPWPLVGNIGPSFIGRRSTGEIIKEIYRKYEGFPFVGIFRATTPVLLVRDPDFVKKIIVRDFKHFQDNDVEVDKDVDPVYAGTPFILKGGSEWKTARSQLSACFTPGKVQSMFPIMQKSSERMVRYIGNEISISPQMESWDLCGRYTLNNVATCAFDIEGKCFDEPHPSFKQFADEFLGYDHFWSTIKNSILLLIPSSTNFFKIKIIQDQIAQKILDYITTAWKHRKENGVVMNDFIDYLYTLKSGPIPFTDLDATSRASVFLEDGYDTSSRTMSFFLFELANNTIVQETLRQEIMESYRENNNSFTYESILKMSYLEACLNESMRKNSINGQLRRVCTEKYTYTPTNPEFAKISITVEPGTSIIVPVGAMQSDPNYFESPDEFKPERFFDMDKIPKYSFMPFGEGPRLCIGKSFGKMQIKVGIVHLLKNYRVTVNQKMQFPLKYNPWYGLLDVIGGMQIDLHKIE